MDTLNGETMRYLIASALQDRSFRWQVIKDINVERKGLAPEVNVDLKRLVLISSLLQTRDKRYDLLFLIMVLIFGVVALIWPIPALVLWIIASAVVYLYSVYDLRYNLLPFLTRDSCDLEGLRDRLKKRYSISTIKRSLPDAEQNIVVYSGFSPFVGVGYPLGGWSFPVTIKKPKEEMGNILEVIPFKLTELYNAVGQSVDDCAFNNCTTRDLLFINGKQIRDKEWILPSIYGNPVECVDDTRIQEYMEAHDSIVRHYKWTYMHDWGGEIAVSYFLRFSFVGSHLFVEANRFLLTPVAEQHRYIDAILLPDLATHIGLIIGSSFLGPLAAIAGALNAIGNFGTYLDELDLLGRRERRKRKEVERNVFYDYGATTSLREKAGGTEYRHYFQMLDKEMHVKIYEKQLLVTVQDFLDAHNIDTSDIKERQTTILNSGVIVQGGEVHAEALAVGTGAQSSIKVQ